MNTIITAIDFVASVDKLDATNVIGYICADAVNALFMRILKFCREFNS